MTISVNTHFLDIIIVKFTHFLDIIIVKFTHFLDTADGLRIKKTDIENVQCQFFLVIPAGFEPTTRSLEGCCSIQLSYETIIFAVQR